MRTTPPRSRLVAGLAAGLLAVGALTACSGTGDDSGAASVGDSATADGGAATEPGAAPGVPCGGG